MAARRLIKFMKSERGATAVEYGLIVSIMIVGLLGALNLFSQSNSQVFNLVETEMANALVSP